MFSAASLFYAYSSHRKSRGPRLVYEVKAEALIAETDAFGPPILNPGEHTVGGDSPALDPAGDAWRDSVTVYFDGTKIPRLGMTRVTIWNAGTSPIRHQDVNWTDPLTIAFGREAVIVNSRIIRINRPPIRFDIKAGRNTIVCDFAHLDPGDGAVLEIFHTAFDLSPNVSGTLIGIPEPRDISHRPDSADLPFREAVAALALSLAILGLSLWGLVATEGGRAPLGLKMLVAVFSFTAAMGLIVTVLSYRGGPNRKPDHLWIPEDFDVEKMMKKFDRAQSKRLRRLPRQSR